MHYQYRWRYTFFVSIIFVFIVYQTDIQFLLKQKKLLAHQLYLLNIQKPSSVIKQLEKRKLIVSEKESLREDAILKANLYDLAIQKESVITTEKSESMIMNHLTLQLIGNYQNIMLYLQSLQQFASPILFKNIIYHLLPSEQLSATIDLIRFEKILENTISAPDDVFVQNPFCHTKKIVDNETFSFKDVPLSGIKVIGFSTQHHDQYIWLMAPGGHVAVVKKQEIFAKENAMITSIQTHQLQLQLASGKNQIISF